MFNNNFSPSTSRDHPYSPSGDPPEPICCTCSDRLRQMLFNLGIHQSDPTTIWCDNQSSITLSLNPSSYTCTKHIAIQHHFIHDYCKSVASVYELSLIQEN